MRILVTKDSSTKIPREIADWSEADALVAQGFHVEQLADDGTTAPLPEKQIAMPPEAVSSEPAPAPAASKAKAIAKKQAPAKKEAAKRR